MSVPVHHVDYMEDEVFKKKTLDAFRGHVGAKNERSQSAPPALMIIVVLEI